MIDEIFNCRMSVRDYECDMQGVVNNAVYQHYLEHARHEFLKSRGFEFADLTRRGIIVVVVHAELDYLQSLRNGDSFSVTVEPYRQSALRLAFRQKIIHAVTGKTVTKAVIITTAVNERGRPWFPPELECLLDI